MVSGEAIGSLGMTEPHAGSDLKAIRTRAVRDGDDFVINGQKVFISNGQLCDFVVLATKTDSHAGAKGVTLFIVESDRPGFKRGRNLEKLGMKAQDTSELFFDNVRIPASNLLGREGKGFAQMMTKLSQERLAQAIRSATVTETVIDWTLQYTSERSAFGQKIADFQNTQFKLAISRPRPLLHASLPTNASRCSWRASSIPSMQRWPKCSPPSFTAKQSTNVCNCSAAGATCGNIRSPGPMPMRG
jgi:alkylation response protein AidB-like acyl-CoA dehydrogenase